MADVAGRVTRILTMIPYIREHPGIHVRELAEWLGCDPDTIVADIETALLCGVPPYLPNDYVSIVVEGDRIHVAFAEHFQRPVNLTFQEAVSLILALRHLPVNRRARAVRDSLERKILDLLPGADTKVLRSARRQMDVGSLHRGVADRVALLEQAIEERREVHMEYYTASRDEMTERTLRPFGIIEHDGEWYVVGHDLLRDAERPFRVDRIRRLELLDTTFELPANFDIERYRAPHMYFPTRRDIRVKLRVSPEMARWVREEQAVGRTREMPDGSLIVHLPVRQPEWIISWVMARAGQVELLAPEALRKKVVAAAQAALRQYE